MEDACWSWTIFSSTFPHLESCSEELIYAYIKHIRKGFNVQVDLQRPKQIRRVQLRGGDLGVCYITTFYILYSNDSYTWRNVRDEDNSHKV